MFKIIPEFPMYMADEEGNILSLYTHKIRKPWIGRDGYPRITLYKDDKTYTVEVHRLVMMAFSEKPEGRVEIHHIDHDKTNNQLENLAWVSHKENLQYDVEAGLRHYWQPDSCYEYAIYKDGELITRVVGLTRAGRLVGLSAGKAWHYANTGIPTPLGFIIKRIGEAKRQRNYSYYSVYKDGQLVKENVNSWEASEISGYSTRRIRDCAKNGITTRTGWGFKRNK